MFLKNPFLMKKYIVTAILLLVASLKVEAQQLPLFSQYSEYQGLINPSAISYDYLLSDYPTTFGISARRQWRDVPSSPITFVAKGEYVQERRNAVSMLYGGFLINDQTGDISSTGAYGRIAGIVTGGKNPKEGGLSLGLMAGIVQYKVDINSLFSKFGNDPLIGEQIADNVIRPDVGIGLTYHKQFGRNGFFKNDYVVAGLSVPQLLGLNVEYGTEDNSFYINRIQHFYLTGSYFKTLTQGTHLEFSTWIKKVKNVPVNFDLVMRYRFVDFMWLGIGINNSQIAQLEFGFFLGEKIGLYDNAFKFGIAYNPSVNSYGPNFGRTLEVNIAYLRF